MNKVVVVLIIMMVAIVGFVVIAGATIGIYYYSSNSVPTIAGEWKHSVKGGIITIKGSPNNYTFKLVSKKTGKVTWAPLKKETDTIYSVLNFILFKYDVSNDKLFIGAMFPGCSYNNSSEFCKTKKFDNNPYTRM